MSRKITSLLITLFFLVIIQSGCIDNPATTESPKPFVSEFQLIWDLFDSQYVGFALKDVNWISVYDQYYHVADNVSSREEMTNLTVNLLAELSDYHVRLIDPTGSSIFTYSPEIQKNYNMDVLMTYLEPSGFQWMQEDIWGYCLAGEDSIPYFVITSWSNDFNTSLFGNVLQPLLESPGLIIDIRMNSGGLEGPVNSVVRMFVDQLRTGYMWQQRLSCETHELSNPVEYLLYPRGWYFSNSVVVLTGETNTGASELFICEMAELPDVTTMGSSTMGASDWPVTNWELPDGWYVSCPSRTVLRPDLTIIEGIGLTPDVYVEVTEADFVSGIDPILEEAFEYLGVDPPIVF